MSQHPYDLEEKLLLFAAEVIKLVNKFESTKAGNHVGGQLIRSGTSPLSNHGEAQAAESQKDFIHKMKVCLKELKESHRWLKLAKVVPLTHDYQNLDIVLLECEELIKIFVSSVKTAQSRLRS